MASSGRVGLRRTLPCLPCAAVSESLEEVAAGYHGSGSGPFKHPPSPCAHRGRSIVPVHPRTVSFVFIPPRFAVLSDTGAVLRSASQLHIRTSSTKCAKISSWP
ncbi:hypothetical protein MTO96_016607 [Rhipicephalus appendiculatus]